MSEFGEPGGKEILKDTTTILPLIDEEGVLIPESKSKLTKALQRSDGKGLVLIHPFFPEQAGQLKDSDQNDYTTYQETLKGELQSYRDQGLPTVLFETQINNLQLEQEMERLRVDGDVFVVPTYPHSPDPKNMYLDDLSQAFARMGAKEAVITGSNLFYLKDKSSPTVKIKGCVGRVLTELQIAGITSQLGEGVFPKKRDDVPIPQIHSPKITLEHIDSFFEKK